jgi:hypothetical protein
LGFVISVAALVGLAIALNSREEAGSRLEGIESKPPLRGSLSAGAD